MRRAGSDDLADSWEAKPVKKSVVDKVEAKAREMVRGERRTVHNMMPELIDGDKIEA